MARRPDQPDAGGEPLCAGARPDAEVGRGRSERQRVPRYQLHDHLGQVSTMTTTTTKPARRKRRVFMPQVSVGSV
jgi:hypothetical protein